MESQRFAIGRILTLAFATLALVLGFSSVSTAIQFGAPDEHAEEAADAEEGGTEPELDMELIAAGIAAYKEAGCRGCHGWSANGEREGPNPQGPSLRDTLLDEAGLRMTVACGRPGTEMPYFWREAYRRDSTECFGVTADALGDLLPNRAAVRLRDDDLDALAYYLANYVKGLGEISRTDCELFFGADAARCEAYE